MSDDLNPNADHPSISVRVHSVPFMDDPDGADAYYAALGRTLVLWGRFENHLHMTILALYYWSETATFRPVEFPTSFKKRAKFWRDSFNRIPALRRLAPEALRVIEQASDSNQDRSVFVHGHFAQFAKDTDEPTGIFTTIRHKRSNFIQEQYNVPISTLQNVTATFDRINTRLLPISWNVSQITFHARFSQSAQSRT